MQYNIFPRIKMGQAILHVYIYINLY